MNNSEVLNIGMLYNVSKGTFPRHVTVIVCCRFDSVPVNVRLAGVAYSTLKQIFHVKHVGIFIVTFCPGAYISSYSK
jgi:hypothetical protein